MERGRVNLERRGEHNKTFVRELSCQRCHAKVSSKGATFKIVLYGRIRVNKLCD